MRGEATVKLSGRPIADYVICFFIWTSVNMIVRGDHQTQPPIQSSGLLPKLLLVNGSSSVRPEWINHLSPTWTTTMAVSAALVRDARLTVISRTIRGAILDDHFLPASTVPHHQQNTKPNPSFPLQQDDPSSPDGTKSSPEPRRISDAKGIRPRDVGQTAPHLNPMVPYPQLDHWGSLDYGHRTSGGRTDGEFSMDIPPLIGDDVFHQRDPIGTQNAAATNEDEDDHASQEGTFFGILETNVTASVGETAFLRCRLQKTHHQVMWIRVRDWHILTSGLLTYTADARFRVKHSAEASEWTLEIKYLQQKDDGTYYCQVPTRTGTAVHAFHLHVASPQAVILGGEVSHVDIHTPSFTLVCIIDNTPNAPQFVFWYHNGTLLKDGKYPENAGGSNSGTGGLITTHMTLTNSRAMSMLTLHNIQHLHSGNYTCTAPNAQSDSTHLFVTQRHEQAAVHRSSTADSLLQPHNWRLVQIASLIGHVLVVRRKFC